MQAGRGETNFGILKAPVINLSDFMKLVSIPADKIKEMLQPD